MSDVHRGAARPVPAGHGGTIPLGAIRGIPVRADVSLLGIAVLLTWLLAENVLPDTASAAARWAAAAVAAAAFLGCVLAHEMSHSIVAVRNGIRVDSVTLWMLGGIARIRDEPAEPSVQVRMAGAGPAASAALGAGFLAIGVLLRAAGAPDVVESAATWLGSVNLVLAVFNLVPAAPLDGGRLLAGYLWKRRGDRLSAAVSAARAGEAFAYVLFFLGLVMLLSGFLLQGIWFGFLGWFLLGAARAEEATYTVQADLAGVRVGTAMTPDPIVVRDDVSVDDLLHDYMLRSPASSFPLVDEAGGVTGLATLRRIREVRPADRERLRARDVAWPIDALPRVAVDDLLLDAIRANGEQGDGRILVFEGDRLCGIVSPSDVTRVARRAELTKRGPR
jgi:Zn-dependent protease/CBS domain-containing protein